MASNEPDVIYRKQCLDLIGKTIFNNKEFSDVTFIVKGNKYHASRIMMSASSKVFADLLKEHFENLTDTEVPLNQIKYPESFFNILAYIHGVDINLTTMAKPLMCELLSLTESYKFDDFHRDLKVYISKLRYFNLDSVVDLLNTAKDYKIDELYETVRIYVYQHAGEFVNHGTFINLKYPVLLDLLGDDLLYCKEIDILRAALNWHSDHIIEVEQVKELMAVVQNEDIVASKNVEDCNSLSLVSINKSLKESSDAKTTVEENDMQNTEKHKDSNNEIVYDQSGTAGEKDEDIYKSQILEKPKGETKELEIFSKNILKKLLSLVRFSRIHVSEFINTLDTLPFTKYKDSIMSHTQYVHLEDKFRKPYSGSTKIFTVKNVDNLMNSSNHLDAEEEHLIENVTWKMSIDIRKGDNTKLNVDERITMKKDEQFLYLTMDTSLEDEIIELSLVDIDFIVLSKKPFVKNKCITGELCDFDQNNIYFYETFLSSSNLYDEDLGFLNDNTLTVLVHFKSIICFAKIHDKLIELKKETDNENTKKVFELRKKIGEIGKN